MATRNVTAVRTPGVPLPEAGPAAGDTEQETDMDAVEAASAPLDEGVAAEAAPTAPDIQAMIAAEVEKRLRQAAQTQAVAAPAELPDQSQIDRKKISRPTLSKQGYVVPEDYGQMPAHLSKNLLS